MQSSVQYSNWLEDPPLKSSAVASNGCMTPPVLPVISTSGAESRGIASVLYLCQPLEATKNGQRTSPTRLLHLRTGKKRLDWKNTLHLPVRIKSDRAPFNRTVLSELRIGLFERLHTRFK